MVVLSDTEVTHNVKKKMPLYEMQLDIAFRVLGQLHEITHSWND